MLLKNMTDFKVGDKVVCINEGATEYSTTFITLIENDVVIIKNHIYTVKTLYKAIKSEQGYFFTRFRLATPAEIRRHEGFTKELESIINEKGS